MKFTVGLMLLAVVVAGSARGEHDAVKGAGRPEAPPSVPKDCGARIGTASFSYSGRGLFSGASYDLSLVFTQDGSGFSIKYNLGINRDFKLWSGPAAAYVSDAGQTYSCSDDPDRCVYSAQLAVEALKTASRRLKRPSQQQSAALVCALGKANVFLEKALAEQAKHPAALPEVSSPVIIIPQGDGSILIF